MSEAPGYSSSLLDLSSWLMEQRVRKVEQPSWGQHAGVVPHPALGASPGWVFFAIPLAVLSMPDGTASQFLYYHIRVTETS